MSDTDPTESTVEPDGGHAAGSAEAHRDTEYLTQEVNLLRPSTSFMQDHLRLIWTGFVAWALIVFGPVTLTAIAPNAMTTQLPVIGFPLHYFLVAIGAPGGSLLLSVWYARKRDKLDQKYGIDHAATEETEAAEDVAVANGGEAK